MQPEEVTATALRTAVNELATDAATRARLIDRSRQMHATDGGAQAAEARVTA